MQRSPVIIVTETNVDAIGCQEADVLHLSLGSVGTHLRACEGRLASAARSRESFAAWGSTTARQFCFELLEANELVGALGSSAQGRANSETGGQHTLTTCTRNSQKRVGGRESKVAHSLPSGNGLRPSPSLLRCTHVIQSFACQGRAMIAEGFLDGFRVAHVKVVPDRVLERRAVKAVPRHYIGLDFQEELKNLRWKHADGYTNG